MGCSMTALPSVLSPSGVLQPPLSQCIIIPTRKYVAHIEKCYYFSFFTSKIPETAQLEVGKGLYCVPNNLSLVPILTCTHSAQNSHHTSLQFISILCSQLHVDLFLTGFLTKTLIHTSYLPHACCMSFTSHSLDLIIRIIMNEQIMNLLTTKYSPSSCYILLPISKH